MELTTDIIKQLRNMTGVSVMQCKKALEEAGGDLAKAEVILKKHSAAAAEKKAERTLKAGIVGSYVHDGSIGAMVILSCESDFVAKNPEFGTLARDIAMQVAATDPLYTVMMEISEESKHAAIAVFEKEVAGKPQEMQAKILEGKLASHFRDHVLLEQPFIKDESKTVRNLLDEATQKFGERIEVSRFMRLSAR
ncbi:MAG: elongation factor Ts [Candidatus Parcubacteria bacterium]|nr:elongation factor Ts [Candidatus Parcubacteria bacterium]